MKLKIWHASKGSGEPPLGLFLVAPTWKRARFYRFPSSVRRLLGALQTANPRRRRVARAVATLLKRPIWPIADERAAMASPWLYDQDAPDGAWTTSPLGVANGVLRPLGLVLVVTVDTDDGALVGLAVHRTSWLDQWRT